MKKTILLMLGLLATTASFANVSSARVITDSETHVRLVATTNQKVKLFIQPRQTNVQIMLKDEAGRSLYTANSLNLKKGFSRQFDVSDLAAGTYQVIVTNETETITKTFVVKSVPTQTSVVVI